MQTYVALVLASNSIFQLPAWLANLILKSHTFDECLVRDEESNIDILSAGTIPSNPQELLSDKGLTS